ncbi:MAG: hypothetical protein ACKVX9_08655 [Blastocatellia bacterium]
MKQQFNDPGSPGEENETALPSCCGTGCTVCVLDYPEYFQSPRESETNTLALLEAFEKAEASIASQDGDSR